MYFIGEEEYSSNLTSKGELEAHEVEDNDTELEADEAKVLTLNLRILKLKAMMLNMKKKLRKIVLLVGLN